MIVNFGVSLLVSRFTPAPPAHIQDLIEDIRIPRGAGSAQVH
jgi:cation/acetate symporter